MKKMLLCTALLSLLSLSACANTWDGLKKDSKTTFENIKEGAQKADSKFRNATDLGPRDDN